MADLRVQRRPVVGAVAVSLLLLAHGCRDGTDPMQSTPAPSPVDRTLAVTVGGHGSGRVTSQPAGIDCRTDGGTCMATFTGGTQVTLTAAPDAGMLFASWGGGCSGGGTCALTMDADRNATADFSNPALVASDVGPGGGEMVSVDGDLRLVIPPGALSETVVITIETLDPASVPLRYMGTVESVGDPPSGDVDEPPVAAWRLGPEGIQFDELVQVIATLDEPDGDVVPWLLSDETADPVEVTDLFREDDGRLTITSTLEHFSSYALLRYDALLTARFLSPENNSVFPPHHQFAWALEATLNLRAARVSQHTGNGRDDLFYETLAPGHGWNLIPGVSRMFWQTPLLGDPDIPPAGAVAAAPIRVDGTGACGTTQGIGVVVANLFADVMLRWEKFNKNGDSFSIETGKSSTNAGSHLKLECRPLRASITQVGLNRVSEGSTVTLPDGTVVIIVGGPNSLYIGPWWSNSVAFLLIYTPTANAIPGASEMTQEQALVFRDAFAAHGTDRDTGGPIIDWPALFQTLTIDPSKVCGGRVVLDIPADQGGLLPGFDPDRKLSGSGRFTGETGGICQNFNITLTGEIEGT